MAAIDTKTLRLASYAQLRDYYNALSQKALEESITSQLLHAIEQGSIKPTTFAPWLGISKSPVVIHAALVQTTSIIIRKLAIKQLRLGLCSRKWKETLSGMGDVPGLLEIFSHLSVIEVREACRSIGTVGKGHDITEKRRFVTDLFEALMGPSFFPNARFKSQDDRPLRKYYTMLVQSCEEKIVVMAAESGFHGVWEDIRTKGLMQFHSVYMQRLCMEKIKDGVAGDVEQGIIRGLTQHYPSASTDLKGVSASMEYALSLLKLLVETERHLLPFDFVVEELITPLLRKALKKKAEIGTLAQILDIFLNYLDTHRRTGIKLTQMAGSPSAPIAQCWARNPSYFDDRIKRFNIGEHDDWGSALTWVPRHKYRFLRLCILQSTGLDLDVDADLKDVKLTLNWWFLDSLSNEKAFELFTRLRAARGDDTLISSAPHDSILDTSKSFANQTYKDADIFNVWLHTRIGKVDAAEQLAIPLVEEAKSRAHVSPDPEERAFYLKKALFAASGSGSLDLLQVTLDWSKRFIRDPLTTAALYFNSGPSEMARLLTGIPEKLDETFPDASIFRQRLDRSNAILVGMFDMACQALQEPHFQSYNWTWVFETIGAVALERINLAPELKRVLQISDTELFELLWVPTINMLIEVEEKAHREGHERLNITHLNGIFARNSPIYQQKVDKLVSTYKFVDEYAKARDSLWQTIRLKTYPAVATLPEPFPRGLPIQNCCEIWNIVDLDEHAPYTASRVRATLFPEPATALQAVDEKDEALWKAIGSFVDDYSFALNLYVPHSCPVEEAQKRLEAVWTYATTQLSRDMTEEEAFGFLSQATHMNSWTTNHNLRDHWPPRSKVPRTVDWPSLPNVDEATESIDWNPLANIPGHKTRELGPVTYHDLSLVMSARHQITIQNRVNVISPVVLGVEGGAHELWKGSRKSRSLADQSWKPVPRNKISEPSVLSALLYIERRFLDEENRLLRAPFPSTDDARYPAMRLADATYKHEDLNIFSAVRDIKDGLDTIPPPLVEKLAREVLKLLSTATPQDSIYIALHEVAIVLIVRLGETDRPALATELAIQTVLERPQSSSWHRQLLKFKFFRRLSAPDARACCEYFTDKLIEKMSEDTAAKESGDDQDITRRVKVTTVKMLVQIMAGTDFVGEEYALDLLATMSQKVTHVDVKATVVKGLLKMLPNATDEQAEKLLANLEQFVPTAGNLNERKPLTEQDWEGYESKLVLPEIEQSHFSTIFTELLLQFEGGHSDAKYFPAFVDRILLPAVHGLQDQTARWAKLFVKKYANGNAELEALSLPPIPREYGTCGRILAADNSCVRFLPRSLLESYTSYLAFNVAPPAAIRAWMKSFAEELKDTPHEDAKRRDFGIFSDLFSRGAAVLSTVRANNILLHLPMETEFPEAAITAKDLQTHFLTLFTAAVHGDAPLYSNLHTHLVSELLMPEYIAQPWWRPHARPILEAMVLYTRKLRTREWDRDPNRSPSVLPDTFRWTLALLDFPYPPSTDIEADPLLSLDRDTECTAFADRLATLLDTLATAIAGEGLSYRRLSVLKTYLATEPVGNQHQRIDRSIGWRAKTYVTSNPRHSELQERRVCIATSLGDVRPSAKRRKLSWLSGTDVLRVEVASWVVEHVSGDESERMADSVRSGWRDVVRGWVECESEEVRRTGIETAGRMFGGVEGLEREKPMEEKRRERLEVSRAFRGRGRGLPPRGFRGVPSRGRGRGGPPGFGSGAMW